MKGIFCGLVLMTLLSALWTASATEQEDQYLQILKLIDRADSLNESGQTNAAKAKYQEAQTALLNIRSSSPTWNAKVVSFRLDYVAGKIKALSQPAPTAVAEPAAAPAVVPEEKPELKDSKPEHKASAVPPTVQVKLLEAGAEPRRVLYLQPKPDRKQTVIMTSKSSMGMSAAESKAEMVKLPSLKMTVSALPRSVTAEGDIPYEMTIDDIQVVAEAGTDPEMVQEMRKSFGAVKGLKILCVATDRGFVKKNEAQIPASADAEVKEAMKEMEDSLANEECLLPKEAVGVGARWEVQQKIRSEGMLVDQTATHQLTAVEGDVITLKSSVVEKAANQKVPNPLSPGSQANLVRMTGSNSGSTKMDLTRILPLLVTSEGHTESTMTLDVGGQKQTVTTKTDSSDRLESK